MHISTLEIDPALDNRLLFELTEPAARLLDYHNSVAKEWMPHELVPFDIARSFTAANPWREEEYPLPQGVRSAIYVNLLTEDNLPYYSPTILGKFSQFGREHPLQVWGRSWTAEEARHSEVIREWVLATRAIDPRHLEIGRIVQMKKGEVPEPPTLAEMLVYTSLQEKATQVAHANTGRMLDKERNGSTVMARVAGDEILHYKFYSGLAGEAFKIDPSTMAIAALNQIRGFKMPGTGIPNFKEHSQAITEAGIYTVGQFLKIAEDTLEQWGMQDLDGLSSDAEIARLRLMRHLERLGRFAAKQLIGPEI